MLEFLCHPLPYMISWYMVESSRNGRSESNAEISKINMFKQGRGPYILIPNLGKGVWYIIIIKNAVLCKTNGAHNLSRGHKDLRVWLGLVWESESSSEVAGISRSIKSKLVWEDLDLAFNDVFEDIHNRSRRWQWAEAETPSYLSPKLHLHPSKFLNFEIFQFWLYYIWISHLLKR